MQVRNPRDLGLLIRERRRDLSLSQAELAERTGVSRHWVMAVEAGKPGVELGLVLDALAALELACNLRPLEAITGERGMHSRHSSSPDAAAEGSGPPAADLSRILSRTRASGRGPQDPRTGTRGGKS